LDGISVDDRGDPQIYRDPCKSNAMKNFPDKKVSVKKGSGSANARGLKI
jgi:hypothetical protein